MIQRFRPIRRVCIDKWIRKRSSDDFRKRLVGDLLSYSFNSHRVGPHAKPSRKLQRALPDGGALRTLHSGYVFLGEAEDEGRAVHALCLASARRLKPYRSRGGKNAAHRKPALCHGTNHQGVDAFDFRFRWEWTSPSRDPGDAGSGVDSRIDYVRLWAVARIWLGLSAAEFWALTPFEYAQLSKVYFEQESRKDARSALLASLYLNMHRKKGRAPFKIEDFMPRYDAVEKEKKPKQSWKAMLGVAAKITEMYGGKVPESVREQLVPVKDKIDGD